MGTLNRLAQECHAENQHWWHDPATGKRLDRNPGEMLMLQVSEISEAMEGERKNLMDDHLPHRKMAEVKLADALIRIFDYSGGLQINLEASLHNHNVAQQSLAYLGQRLYDESEDKGATNKAEQLFWIVQQIANEDVEVATFLILQYAAKYNYDLDNAVAEKRAYNRQRADHKAEARLAAGGKQW